MKPKYRRLSRGFFAGARGEPSTFMVYEDERWSFDETMRHVDALASARRFRVLAVVDDYEPAT